MTISSSLIDARSLNCGKILRALTTTHFQKWKTKPSERDRRYGKNVKDWTIRSETPCLLLPKSIGGRSSTIMDRFVNLLN